MKYAQIKKEPKEKVEEALHELCIDKIGEEYRVLWKSDDGGLHIVVAFEEFVPEIAKEYLHGSFMGWRLILMKCPEGYLQAFYPIEKSNEVQ